MPKPKETCCHFDAETRRWFVRHLGAQTTVQQCDRCGLYYKPILGHKCKVKHENRGE